MPEEKNREHRARSFRLACADSERELVLDLLAAQGFASRPEPFSTSCRTVEDEPFPLGSSLANRFGLIYIQDRSSMLAPLALNPPPGAVALDMCAAPGGKTGFLAGMVGPEGCVLANEPSHDRLDTLRRTLFRCNLFNTATLRHADLGGRQAPESFDRILLDPPCSGWGTVDKHPKAAKIWRGEKTAALIALQRKLLETAVSLLRPGGALVYSTCTTNPAENEEQTAWALERFGLALTPLDPPPGFVFAPPRLSGLEGALLVDAEQSRAQGHYIVRMEKPDGPTPEPEPAFDPPGERVPRQALAGMEGLAPGNLPPGELFCFRDKLFFLHAASLDRGRAGTRLRGFFLGAFRRGRFRPHPMLRRLLPPFEETGGINAEDPAEITALLSGQSMVLAPLPSRPGLYYKGLPLGRLTAKGGRVLWSDR